jgi:two-component system, OmpR family, KDP operon response regulator KdpE
MRNLSLDALARAWTHGPEGEAVIDTIILIAGADCGGRADLAASVADAGYAVAVAQAADASIQVRDIQPAAVVLETTHVAPDVAVTLVQCIRSLTPQPLLVVVASDDDCTGPAALDAGADDFLRRPLAAPELHARLRAHLRRCPDR